MTPARDRYHDVVKDALAKDGWTVNRDPLRIPYGGRALSIDLGAERLLAAERGQERIAVEIKVFDADLPSPVTELQQAAGQYAMYRMALAKLDPERRLYLAIDISAHGRLFSEPLGQDFIAEMKMKLLVFDSVSREIVRWKA